MPLPPAPLPARPEALYKESMTPVDWAISRAPVPYPAAVAVMEARAAAIRAGAAAEMVWLLEHPPLYTAGLRAREADLRAPARFPVFRSSRGGQFTYHGPGQRVAYVLLDLAARGPDLRAFVCGLENWLIGALAEFGVAGEHREGRPGVWVRRGGQEAKIAAIGVRVRHWVSLHGIALNVMPDLDHFSGIVPCGLPEYGVTSLADLGHEVTLERVDAALARSFVTRFGPLRPTAAPELPPEAPPEAPSASSTASPPG